MSIYTCLLTWYTYTDGICVFQWWYSICWTWNEQNFLNNITERFIFIFVRNLFTRTKNTENINRCATNQSSNVLEMVKLRGIFECFFSLSNSFCSIVTLQHSTNWVNLWFNFSFVRSIVSVARRSFAWNVCIRIKLNWVNSKR